MATWKLAVALLLAAPQATGASRGFADEVRVGDRVERGNLAVFPLKLRDGGRGAPEPATLDEAVARRELAVREAGPGGEVNALEVENRGDRPVWSASSRRRTRLRPHPSRRPT